MFTADIPSFKRDRMSSSLCAYFHAFCRDFLIHSHPSPLTPRLPPTPLFPPQRLSCMALDRRSWLVVTGRPVQRPHPDAPGHTRTFSTLAEAVQASQPGHTILLQGGQPHRVSGQPVVIRHALRLLGSGGRAEAVVLRGDPGLETVLLFHSLAQLLNLSVHSVRGACLMHLAGTLRVGGCILESSAAGLPHLVSQIALAGDAAERRRLHFDETRLLVRELGFDSLVPQARTEG